MSDDVQISAPVLVQSSRTVPSDGVTGSGIAMAGVITKQQAIKSGVEVGAG